ncbi:MAG: flagellar basal body rod protein FlgB [Thermodesulfobacteriota bacterium]|nr:flagellar basal body rod protein FlgB [Thermodesulfobacteriota bacterium]
MSFNEILFSNRSSKALEKILDLCAFNQKVLASNIANAETPGYKVKEVDFDKILKEFREKKLIKQAPLIKTKPGHFPLIDTENPLITKYNITSCSIDENSVNLDKEMSKIAQNQLLYNTSLVFLRKKGQILLSAVTEGRR